MSVRSAVRIASSASCLALLNPIKGAFLGSHSRTMLVLGKASKIALSLLSIRMDSC